MESPLSKLPFLIEFRHLKAPHRLWWVIRDITGKSDSYVANSRCHRLWGEIGRWTRDPFVGCGAAPKYAVNYRRTLTSLRIFPGGDLTMMSQKFPHIPGQLGFPG